MHRRFYIDGEFNTAGFIAGLAAFLAVVCVFLLLIRRRRRLFNAADTDPHYGDFEALMSTVTYENAG